MPVGGMMKKIILILMLMLLLSNHAFADSHNVRVVAYPLNLPGSNGKAASGLKLNKSHCGYVVALSHDLAKKYKKGDQFKLHLNNKTMNVIYHDKMAPKYLNTVDILLPTKKMCREFGSQKGVLVKHE